MKKLLLICHASALLLASCGGKNDETQGSESESANTPVETPAVSDVETEPETEADTEGDAAIDDGTSSSAVTKVESVEDAIAFIDNNVYSQCQDYLPMMIMSMALPLEDADMVGYHTGLTDTTGITDIILSESGVGSFAYSFVMVRTDGTNTEAIRTELGEKIDPRKWVCVTAEKVASVVLDNDIILVMGAPDQVDAIMGAVTSAAEGVYENIGSVVNVLG